MKFLVESRDFIGETMLDIPLFRAIARKGHHLEVIVAEHCASMLQDCTFIGAVHIRTTNRSWKSRYNTYLHATEHKCDMILGTRPHLLYRLLKLCGRTRAWRHRSLVDSVHVREGAIYARLSILDGLVEDWSTDINTNLLLKPIRFATAFRVANLGSKSEPYLTVAPGSSLISKQWPMQNFAEVIRKVRRNFARILVVGSPAEHRLCSELAAITGTVSLAGKLSLIETCALISRAALHIGNDSGLGHVAAGNGTTVLAIGGREDGYYAPWRQHMLRGQVKSIGTEQVIVALSEIAGSRTFTIVE